MTASSLPRRLKRTTDGEWRVETLGYLRECADELAALETRRTALLALARDAGNEAWLVCAAGRVSQTQLYRLLPDELVAGRKTDPATNATSKGSSKARRTRR